MEKAEKNLKTYLDIYFFDLYFLAFALAATLFLLLGVFVWKWFVICALITALPNLAYCIYKLISYRAKTSIYSFAVKLDKPVKFVFLSDLHFHKFMPKDYYKKAFRTVNALKPDAILFGGDFVHDRNTDLEQLKELKLLEAKYKIGVLGNHDYDIQKKDFRIERVTKANLEYGDLVEQALEKNGVEILRNENLEIHGINIFGLDSLWAKKNDLSKYRPAKHNIILAHNPRSFEGMNAENAKNVDLVLCGHNHGGGQIRLNKWISAHVLMAVIQPIWHKGFGRWVSGEYKNKSGQKMILSRGLGLTGVSVRINCPPEIRVIEIS